MRPIQLLSRQQPHLAALEPRLDPIAVKFDFVEPSRPVWRSAVQSSEARRHEIRKSAAPLAGEGRIGATLYGNWRRRLCCRFRFCSAPARLFCAPACFPTWLGLCLQLGAKFALALRLCILGWFTGLTITVPNALFALARRDLIH